MHHIENALPGDIEAKAGSHGPQFRGLCIFWVTEANIVDKQDTDMTRFYVIIILI